MEADQNPEMQATLLKMSADSIVFWVNVFGWTLRQKMVDEDGKTVQVYGVKSRWPFITWPFQDHTFNRLLAAILGGHDLMIDKSRDMGASWMCLMALLHQWLFNENATMLMLSRKEEEVDKAGNRKSLFWKLLFALENLPDWMKPYYVKTHMHLENFDRANVIDGETTNKHAARGDRRLCILCDEFGAVDEGFEILAATADATDCRIFNSTPGGIGTAFTHLHFQAVRTGKPERIVLHWRIHPEKGRGLTTRHDPETGDVKCSSPWYEGEKARRQSDQEIARELDINHGQAGDNFFDINVINRQMSMYAEPGLKTMIRGVIRYTDTRHWGDVDERIRAQSIENLEFIEDDAGEWCLWVPGLDEMDQPRQDTRYCLGCDVSAGLGASNSVIAIGDREDGRKVAEWAAASFKPYEMARVACMAALWFGGANALPLIGWEANGPGGEFGDEIVSLYYPRIYFMQDYGRVARRRSDQYGWHSNPSRKCDEFGRYRRNLARDEYINMSTAALSEASEYILLGKTPVPNRLRSEPDGAREAHGDRVIADVVLNMVMEEEPRFQEQDQRRAPPGSPAWRREQRRAKARERASAYWD